MMPSRRNHRLAFATLCLVAAGVVDCSDPAGPEPEVVENQPPQAMDDTAETGLEAPVVIDILANDTDPDGTLDPASVAVAAAPDSGGTDVDPETGALTYTPAPGFFGTDSLQYTVADREALTSNAATVVITVLANKPPVAENDEATTNEDTPVVIDVLANDTDPDGTIGLNDLSIVTPPASGTALISSIATRTLLVYDPAPDVSGTDSLQYTLQDTQGTPSAPARVVITIVPVNDAPAFTGAPTDTSVAIGDTLALPITLEDIDTGPDALTLTASLNDAPLPDWLVLTMLEATNGTATATLTARPTDAVAPGPAEITLQAGDGEAESIHTFMLTVTDSSN